MYPNHVAYSYLDESGNVTYTARSVYENRTHKAACRQYAEFQRDFTEHGYKVEDINDSTFTATKPLPTVSGRAMRVTVSSKPIN